MHPFSLSLCHQKRMERGPKVTEPNERATERTNGSAAAFRMQFLRPFADNAEEGRKGPHAWPWIEFGTLTWCSTSSSLEGNRLWNLPWLTLFPIKERRETFVIICFPKLGRYELGGYVCCLFQRIILSARLKKFSFIPVHAPYIYFLQGVTYSWIYLPNSYTFITV